MAAGTGVTDDSSEVAILIELVVDFYIQYGCIILLSFARESMVADTLLATKLHIPPTRPNLFPPLIPPPLQVVDEYLTKAVGAVLRRGMEQQENHFFDSGADQHSLAGGNESAIIADRFFGMLSH